MENSEKVKRSNHLSGYPSHYETLYLYNEHTLNRFVIFRGCFQIVKVIIYFLLYKLAFIDTQAIFLSCPSRIRTVSHSTNPFRIYLYFFRKTVWLVDSNPVPAT